MNTLSVSPEIVFQDLFLYADKEDSTLMVLDHRNIAAMFGED